MYAVALLRIQGVIELEKKDFPISTRIDENLNEKLEDIISSTGKTKGEQVRVAIKRFIQTSERLRKGESMTWLPAIEIDKCKKTLTELDEILSMKDDLKMSDSTVMILNSIIDSLEWSLLNELKKKFPDEDGFFNLR